jgi:DNA-binding NarL/FixJ family response regulator
MSRHGSVKLTTGEAVRGLIETSQVSVSVSIVEDDGSIRQILTDWINGAAGFKCQSTHDSAESAMAKLPAEQPAIVLVDINLPGQTGIECVRRLKPVMSGTQFVMLTVYEDSAHIFDALKAGASGYLLKRTPCDELIASLRQVREGGSPMTSFIARKVVQSFYEAEPKQARAEGLSPREREVLELLARGYFYKEITEALNLSISTVNTHVRRIYEKLHVHSRAQAVAKLAELPRRK